jgi:hypothetical protein
MINFLLGFVFVVSCAVAFIIVCMTISKAYSLIDNKKILTILQYTFHVFKVIIYTIYGFFMVVSLTLVFCWIGDWIRGMF